HSYIDEDVRAAAGDQRFEHVLDSAQRRVLEIDAHVVPLLEAERPCTLIGAVAKQRVRREDVTPAGLAARDPFELAQFLEWIDAHIRIRADADADRPLAHAL